MPEHEFGVKNFQQQLYYREIRRKPSHYDGLYKIEICTSRFKQVQALTMFLYWKKKSQPKHKDRLNH